MCFCSKSFFLLISLPFYIIAILDSNIFHNRYSNIINIILFFIFLLMVFIINFLGVIFGIDYGVSFKSQLNKKFENWFKFIKNILFIIPLIFMVFSLFFRIPRVIIQETGMGGKFYKLIFSDKSYHVNGYYCVFIQTKHSLYVTQEQNKDFCRVFSSDTKLGTLIRIPEKEIISVAQK